MCWCRDDEGYCGGGVLVIVGEVGVCGVWRCVLGEGDGSWSVGYDSGKNYRAEEVKK